MPIWSLTQERVERIKRQIGDKELEIDVIVKLSPKDLWISDLDDFIELWHHTNAEDKLRRKKVRQGGRRASAKLGTTGKIKKKKVRAESDDEDFEVGKKKSTAALKAIQDRAKNKGKGSLWGNFLENGPAKPEEKPKVVELDDDDDFMDIDKIEQPPVQAQEEVSEVVAVKQKAPTLVKKAPAKPAPVDLDSDDDVFLAAAEEPIKKAAPSRAARAAKPKKLVVPDDSEESDFDDNALGDLSLMVKPGILGQSVSAAGRTLFTAPTMRPGSSHGLTSQKVAMKSKTKSPNDSDNGIDDTDFNGLLQGSPRRALTKPGESGMGLSDDDDTLGMPIRKTSAAPKPKAPATKPAAASKLVAKKPPLKKASAVAAAPKVTPLSPAAKAYAARLGKEEAASKVAPKKKPAPDSDDEEEVANEILSSDDDMDDAPVVARPSRRAATTATKGKYAIGGDSDEEDEESQEEDYDEDEESD